MEHQDKSLMNKKIGNPNSPEQLVLIAVIILTVFQFSIWGYKIAIYILGKMFSVSIPDVSFFTSIVGLLALIGSVLIIIGSGYWFVEKWEKASSLVNAGVLFFVGKNVVDVIDSLVVFTQTVKNPGVQDIQRLAGSIGVDLAQLIFWILIGVYLSYRAKKHLAKA